MLIDSDVRFECLRLCKPQMFFIPVHRLLFITLDEIESAGATSNGAIDFLELKQELNRKGRLIEFGATLADQKQTLAELFDFVPTAANWKYYFDLLTDRYRRREVIRFCRKLETHAADLLSDAAQSVVDNVESLLVRFFSAWK